MLARRIRRVVTWIVALYLCAIFLMMGYQKFLADGFWTGPFERWGYPVWMRIGVGIAEVAGGALIVLPRASKLGAGILSAVMLGALFTRLRDGAIGDSVAIVVYILAFIWVAWEFRLPSPWKKSPAGTE